MDEHKKRALKFFGLVILVIVGLTLFFGAWTVVNPGERGIKVTLGTVDQNILNPGFHFKLPLFTGVEKISVQTQTDSDKLPAASSDLQDVTIETVVNWHVDSASVIPVYQQYQGLDNYTSSVIGPIIRDAVKATSAKYTAEELVQKRDQFASDVAVLLHDELAQKGAVFERVNIVNFEFSDSFTKAIEAKVVAQQDALAAQNKLQQVQFEADQAVATAQGQAKAIAIQAAAIQSQGGADYVKLQWIARWNGALPTTELGSNTPIVDFSK